MGPDFSPKIIISINDSIYFIKKQTTVFVLVLNGRRTKHRRSVLTKEFLQYQEGGQERVQLYFQAVSGDIQR